MVLQQAIWNYTQASRLRSEKDIQTRRDAHGETRTARGRRGITFEQGDRHEAEHIARGSAIMHIALDWSYIMRMVTTLTVTVLWVSSHPLHALAGLLDAERRLGRR